MKVKRTLALWLLSAMFVVCTFFGMLSLNNKVVHAEASTPTWEQTVGVDSTVIAFESPVENWKESPAVLHFDSDQPSVTITLLLDINDWSSRVTTKGAFSGTLVEGNGVTVDLFLKNGIKVYTEND